MLKRIRVKLDERVVVFRSGLPVRALGPGRYVVWGRYITEQRWNTGQLTFSALPEVREKLPDDWYEEVELKKNERGVLFRDGRPVSFLRPGVHRYWKVDPSVELRVFVVDAPMPEMTDELYACIPGNEFVDVTVEAHECGVHFVQGRFKAVLEPGRYLLWNYQGARNEVRKVDMRGQQVAIVGQDLMTRDKVTLRVSLTVEYAVADARKVLAAVADVRDAVYLIVQLAARDYVASVTLDQLLEGRDEMTRYLFDHAMPKAAALGVRLERVGAKDIVLPGDMKDLLNKVIAAEKEAAANVILRREETAATRSLANTARVMADHPVLLRLKELEAMKDIAERIQEVRVVVGAEKLDAMLPSNLLGK